MLLEIPTGGAGFRKSRRPSAFRNNPAGAASNSPLLGSGTATLYRVRSRWSPSRPRTARACNPSIRMIKTNPHLCAVLLQRERGVPPHPEEDGLVVVPHPVVRHDGADAHEHVHGVQRSHGRRHLRTRADKRHAPKRFYFFCGFTTVVVSGYMYVLKENTKYQRCGTPQRRGSSGSCDVPCSYINYMFM